MFLDTGSSVGITRRQRGRSSSTGRDKIIALIASLIPVLGTTQSSSNCSLGHILPMGVRRTWRKTDYSPSIADLKNTWIYICIPSFNRQHSVIAKKISNLQISVWSHLKFSVCFGLLETMEINLIWSDKGTTGEKLMLIPKGYSSVLHFLC
jgi:hypothetical protein